MWFIRSLNQNNEPQSMHPEENGAVADRFAKQSSEYDAVALATFVYESHDQRLSPLAAPLSRTR